jgi:hypothetical protein
MKFKFLKLVLVSIYLSVSSFANAGLILGNQEFLGLGVTTGKTKTQIETMIAGDNSLAGYALATNVDMANIWNRLPYMQESNAGWRGLTAADKTPVVNDIFDWFFTGTHNYQYRSASTFNTEQGSVTYDSQQLGHLWYENSVNGAINSGVFNILRDAADASAIYNRGTGNNHNLGDVNTAGEDVSNHHENTIGGVYVRSTSVPEPSTLAIFALGMIGLATRRFKKQA